MSTRISRSLFLYNSKCKGNSVENIMHFDIRACRMCVGSGGGGGGGGGGGDGGGGGGVWWWW